MSNASSVHNFQLENKKLCAVIDLSLLIFKKIYNFYWVGLARFYGETSGKIGTKLENAQFPKALKGNFYCLSLNGKSIPHFTILTPNSLFDSRTEPEKLKKLCF